MFKEESGLYIVGFTDIFNANHIRSSPIWPLQAPLQIPRKVVSYFFSEAPVASGRHETTNFVNEGS
jgi:hypothetical protein